MINKVEICGVNTSKLPVLSKKEKEELLLKIKNGRSARCLLPFYFTLFLLFALFVRVCKRPMWLCVVLQAVG